MTAGCTFIYILRLQSSAAWLGSDWSEVRLVAITPVRLVPDEQIGHQLLLLDCRPSSPSLLNTSAVWFFCFMSLCDDLPPAGGGLYLCRAASGK